MSQGQAIEQAADLLGIDAAEAGRRARLILRAAPGDPRAALILASAHRRLGEIHAAHALLEPLARAWPNAAQTQYELGLVLAAMGQTDAAIAALRRAVAAKRDLAEAWRALGDQLFLVGDVAGADLAFAEHARAAVRDPLLRPAADALFAGRPAEAEQRLLAALATSPDHAEALHLLGDALIRQGRDAEAEPLIAHCLALDPAFDGARFTYANLLFRRQRGRQALAQIETLWVRDPQTPAYRNLLAACLALVGEHARAIDLYDGLLRQFAKQPKIWLNLGHALRTVGRRPEAVTAYRTCLAIAPGLGEAYWSLANLKAAELTAADEAAMIRLLSSGGLADDDRLHLHFALGKTLEDRGAFAASFEHYAKGAGLRRAALAYDADAATAMMQRNRAVFTGDLPASRAHGGSVSTAPIFIVGLPRSGSTLVEQILASHSAVEGTMELPDIGLIARALSDASGTARPYPESLADLSPDQRRVLGERYLDGVAIHRRLGRPLFIDKMPNNFHHIGLIQLILPNAKIIDARRHPLGSCFSAFKQHFAEGQAFSYDLGDLGRYYRDYVDLMAHFDAILPGRIHRVIYEDLVEDTETEIRRMLSHCGLPFEAACLNFHRNDRAVRTVSSEQVRRPIFRDGLEQWRHYEAWLGPLKTALGPALQTWRRPG